VLLRGGKAEKRFVPVAEGRQSIAAAFGRVRRNVRDVVDEEPKGGTLRALEAAPTAQRRPPRPRLTA
jgi:hypothetical protein